MVIINICAITVCLFDYTVLYLCAQGPTGPPGGKGEKGEVGEPVVGPKGFKVCAT